MLRFNPLENIRKPNISYPLIHVRADVRTDAYQGVRNVSFSDVFRGIKRNHLVEKSYIKL